MIVLISLIMVINIIEILFYMYMNNERECEKL